MARGVPAACALAGAVAFIFCGIATASLAQTVQPNKPAGSDIETVTVTGERIPAEVIHAFVQSYARTASSSLDKITRWKKPICVGTEGLSSEDLNQFVTERIEQIAAQSGMPVGVHPCKLNVEIRFTSSPQAFLDQVRVEGPALLTPKRSQVADVAVMRHPIQAWYATGIEDRDGTLILNDEESVGFYGSGSGGNLSPLNTVPTMHAEGSLLRTGLQSEMAHVFVVADSGKTGDFRLGPIADYVAMLALSQAPSFDECRPLPSITNLFAAGCGEALKPVSVTDTDIAFLRGLYNMDAGANLLTQQSGIAGEIEKVMKAKGF
ncbi:MAG TPA: hypothetical protein VNW15_14435 [Rhizomicrobium sp.]|nr:hypothetical protein [Rhizomicrobium sp.]